VAGEVLEAGAVHRAVRRKERMREPQITAQGCEGIWTEEEGTGRLRSFRPGFHTHVRGRNALEITPLTFCAGVARREREEER